MNIGVGEKEKTDMRNRRCEIERNKREIILARGRKKRCILMRKRRTR